MIIRKIKENDAEGYLNLCKKLDEETDFLLFEPGERTTSIEEQRRKIKDILSNDNQTIFVAEQDGELVGFMLIIGGNLKRTRHCAYVVAGILQTHVRQGVGTKLCSELFNWSKTQKTNRLECTVRINNKAAIGLVEKLGFEIEGIKKRAVFIRDHFEDSYYMARLLD